MFRVYTVYIYICIQKYIPFFVSMCRYCIIYYTYMHILSIYRHPGEGDVHVLVSEGCTHMQVVESYFFGVCMDELNGHPGKWVWLMENHFADGTSCQIWNG